MRKLKDLTQTQKTLVMIGANVAFIYVAFVILMTAAGVKGF